MKIVIASHKRINQIQSKTFALLLRHNFDFKNIYVFVSPSSYDDYLKIQPRWEFNLIKSKDSILKTRNHIIEYFDEGEKIIEMDDDIEDIENTTKGIKNTPVNNLKKLFLNSFDKLKGSGLFGFNSNTNNYFASGVDKFGLYSIVNSCLGYYNDKRIKMTVEEKEDFERCLQFYKLKIHILKRTAFGIKTRYWKNKGGIQDKYDFDKRVIVQRESAEALMNKYPKCCFTRTRKNGIVDIRFKRDPFKLYIRK